MEHLPCETLGRVIVKMKEPIDVLRLCETSTVIRSMVESGLLYAHRRGWMKSKTSGIVYDEDETDTQGSAMDSNGITILKVLEYIGSWYLFKWLLVQEEHDYQAYYKQHKFIIDYFLEHLMRWKPAKKDINPRVKLALTTFRKMTTRASKSNAIVVTTVDGIKKETGVPKRAQMLARESIPVSPADEFLLQVMHMQLLRPDECKGGDERSMRVLRVYQRSSLSAEQKLAGEPPIKRYIIKHGGLGGHWGDDQGQMLDIATSISHNAYLNQNPAYAWFSPFIMNAVEIICECMHDIDCNLDDQRIDDPRAFKSEFLKKMAALVVSTSKNK